MSYASYSQLGNNGRLGNSLFQLAALMAYCNKYSKTPLFPDWPYLKYFKNLPSPIPECPKFASVYIEPHFHFSEIPFFSDNLNLEGYFQATAYHKGIDVQHLFELKDEYKKHVDELYANLNPNGLPTIAVHHRFGDYLNPGTKEYHGNLTIEYYIDAFDAVLKGRNKTDFQVLVFSDEAWRVKESIFYKHFPNHVFIEGNEDIIDLFLMAKSENVITANSSFSFWGSYLGDWKSKKIAMPKQWFYGANHNTKDLYLPNAIII